MDAGQYRGPASNPLFASRALRGGGVWSTAAGAVAQAASARASAASSRVVRVERGADMVTLRGRDAVMVAPDGARSVAVTRRRCDRRASPA